MARRKVKAAQTIRREFGYHEFMQLAKEWYWGGAKNIPVGNMGDKRYTAAYKEAYDAYVDAILGGRVEARDMKQIPEAYLRKIGLTKTIGPGIVKPGKVTDNNPPEPKTVQSPVVTPTQTPPKKGSIIGTNLKPPIPVKQPETDPIKDAPTETPAGLPIQEKATVEPKEQKFEVFKGLKKRVGMNMLSSVLGSNPITSPIGDMIDLKHEQDDDETRKNKKEDGDKPSRQRKSKESPPAPTPIAPEKQESKGEDPVISQIRTVDYTLHDAIVEIKNVDATGKEIVEGIKKVEEYAKTIATNTQAPLEQATEKVAETKTRVGGEKLTLAEKRARSQKFTDGMKSLEDERSGIKGGALSESPLNNAPKPMAAVSSLVSDQEKAPDTKGIMSHLADAFKAIGGAVKTGATSAKNSVTSLLTPTKPAETDNVESTVEGSIKEGEDIAILKDIDTNTKDTTAAIVKLSDTISKMPAATEGSSEPTASPSPVGGILDTVKDVADMLPEGKGAAKGAAKAGGKLSKLANVAKMGTKVLGVGAAAYDVGSGINDLLDGKEQKEMPTGMDMLSPMKWGMYGGAKIREATGGGTGGFLDNATDWIGDKITGNKISKWSQDSAPVTGVAKNGAVPAEIDAAKAKSDQIDAAQAAKSSGGGNSSTTNNVTNNEATTQMSIRSQPRNQDNTWQRVMQGRY